MRTSSRTPEGIPNRCPLCGAVTRIEPSSPAGDAPCPTGALGDFDKAAGRSNAKAKETAQTKVKGILAAYLRNVQQIADWGEYPGQNFQMVLTASLMDLAASVNRKCKLVRTAAC